MKLFSSIFALVLVFAVACGGDGPPAGVDSGTRADAGIGMDTGAPGTDSGSTTDAGMMRDGVRFIVMGDTGEGNEDQRLVAVQIRDLCALEGCDFVMLLGDNIYDAGADSIDDMQWQTKFEDPYTDVDLPFYPVLGNHDYGGEDPLGLGLFEAGGLGNEFDKGPIEVQYSSRSMKWMMPATHYTFQIDNVGFVMLDTNSILWNNTDNGDQRAWLPGAIADLRTDGAEWILSAGHHPYLSNGAHGNAGAYEAIELGDEEILIIDIPVPVPLLNGGNVKSFFDDLICGQVDVAFAGHDHNRQWIDEPGACGGTELIVSGAGAKVKGFDNTTRNTLLFGDDALEGFLYVVIQGDSLYGRMVDKNGNMQFENTVTRTP